MYPIIQRLGRANLDKLIQGLKKYPDAFSAGVSIFAPNRMMSEVDYDQFYKEISNAVKILKEKGVDVHINVGSTIGHSDSGVGGDPLSVPTMVDSKGGGCIASACPRSEDFKKLLGKTISEYAILKPKSILIDDDFRLSFHQPVDYGCFCDDCIKKFNDLHGFELSRKNLEKALLDGEIVNQKNVREFWLEFNRNAILELAKVIADSAHKIDPKIIIGYMQINPEWVAYEMPIYERITKVSKNIDGEVWYRHGSGFYSDFYPYEVVDKNVSIGRLCSLTKSDKYKVTNFTEEVTVPYVRRGKSIKISVLECVMNVAFAGADGVMDEAVQGYFDEQLLGKSIAYTMHENHAYLSKVKQLVKGKKQRGVYPYFSPNLWIYNDKSESLKKMEDLGASDFKNIIYTGVPITFDQKSADCLLLSGKTVRAMSNDEMDYWFSRGVYMDGTSAIETNLIRSNLTGVKKSDLSKKGVSEYFTDHELNGKAKSFYRFNYAQALNKNGASLVLDGATALSYATDNREGDVVGTAIFENGLNGRICVNSRGAWDLDILGKYKTEQIKNVFDYLAGGKMPVRLECDCRVATTVWEDDDERVVFLFNLDFDDETDAKLILDKEFNAEILKEDLTFESIGRGKELNIPKITSFTTAVIRLKK